MQHLFSIVFTITALTSCDFFRVVTSSDKAAKVETSESVNRFTKKQRIDGYPIVCIDHKNIAVITDLLGASFSLYNKEGAFLDLGLNQLGCTDRVYYSTVLRYILEHGDSTFVTDLITRKYYTRNDSSIIASPLENRNRTSPDLSTWITQTETHDPHFEYYTPFFRTLEGDHIDVRNFYDDYLLIWPFLMSGRSALTSVLIRETIRDVKKLNKEFDNRIQIVLLNFDRLAWMSVDK